MATLKFYDTHNMIAYLNQTEGSEGFHQIVDFLNSSHIKFALTENPTIYTSLIQQFWKTAIANIHDTREIQITATIDGNVKLISEASIRRCLKLKDSDGISTLPNTEIFEQLALTGVPTPPHDSPLPRGHTPGSNEGSLTLNELTILCTTLSNKVESLETKLKLTKQTYGAAFTKLIKKVKKLEKTVKTSQARRRAKIVISDDDIVLEDSSKHRRMIKDINQDARVIVHTYSKRRRAISTGSGGVSTDGVSMPVITTGMVQESISSPRATKDKAQTFIKDEWENIRARVKADEELTQRLQAEEREKYCEDDRTKMLVDLINQRKKFYAQQRAKAKRNKPMTNILFQWKEKTDEALGSVQEQPVEEEKELSQKDLQQLMIIALEQGMNVKALQVKYLIIDWEIYTEDSRKYWKIIRIRNHTEEGESVLVTLQALFGYLKKGILNSRFGYKNDKVCWSSCFNNRYAVCDNNAIKEPFLILLVEFMKSRSSQPWLSRVDDSLAACS
uniref:Xylulose kinase-1 n=1 Tax=Tanacetum cinerariifolium TaxID=118510 RepID=A0A6L2N716_TANCI|nr:xylulose kinase-1 [Tanacetum cinerariifolium]